MLCRMAPIFSLFTPHNIRTNTLFLRILLSVLQNTILLLPIPMTMTILLHIPDPLRLLMLPVQPTILLTNIPPTTYKLLLSIMLHLHSSLCPLGYLSSLFHACLSLLAVLLHPRISLNLLGCCLLLLTYLALHILILSLLMPLHLPLLMTLQSSTLLLVLLTMPSR